MSKAFTKEDDGPENIRLDDLPISAHPNYVTSAGLAALRERLAMRTRELEKLKSNDEGMESQMPIAVAERDIRYLNTRINQAILVDPAEQKPGIVAFGATVEVVDANNRKHVFRIVGEDEADPALGLITLYSPLAIALTGAQVGDSVAWRKPAGAVDLEVVSIRFD